MKPNLKEKTIQEAIMEATNQLKNGQIDEANLKSKILMEYILKKDRQYILAYGDNELTQEQNQKYFELINKLKQNIPIEYITKTREFMKMNFYVDENVLIPRPDTEILVEEVIKIAKEINAKTILDLCTGSGAIAISLAKYLENAKITATDISEQALKIAKKNAQNSNVADKINFIKSDIFKEISTQKYDIIVSNPPYIETEVIKELEENVKKEPHIALDGGKDGLDFYREIYKQGYKYLSEKGYICVEIGYNQKNNISDIINEQQKYEDIYVKKDLSDNDRVIIVRCK